MNHNLKTYGPIFWGLALAVTLVSVASTSIEPVITDDSHQIVDADTMVARIWKEECSSCHGKDGKGMTKAGRRAKVKDFTDPEYQATWTDEEAIEVVSTSMKNGEQLKNKKPYSEKLTKDEIKQMVAFVRTFVE